MDGIGRLDELVAELRRLEEKLNICTILECA